MKLQFKTQQFQIDAVQAVVDAFEGQPHTDTGHFTIDKMQGALEFEELEMNTRIGYRNRSLQISLEQVLENVRRVQRRHYLPESLRLEQMPGYNGGVNLTVEMETGTGKTYTYTRTMYELHRAYGWSKYVIVVPSVAIREGVASSLRATNAHFTELYGQSIRAYVYNSKHPQDIRNFATDSHISVMIINTQAFNSTGKDRLRIDQASDQFNTQAPIEILADTQSVLIIDEPQTTDGPATLESYRKFKALFALRYSATHRVEYNKVYRLDALDAYNRRLVKQIEVKGLQLKGNTGTSGYLYLDHFEVRKNKPPRAWIAYDQRKGKNGEVKRVCEAFAEGDSLYERSGELPVYQGYVVTGIDVTRQKIEVHGQIIREQDGVVDEQEILDYRRRQIHETIKSHLEKEQRLYSRGIKVLSLFFIDEVERYRKYDEAGNEVKGDYARIFEEEYRKLQSQYLSLWEQQYNEYLARHGAASAHQGYTPSAYYDYLKRDDADKIHAGYFAIDGKGHFRNVYESSTKEEREKEETAYELIMRDKEGLLSLDQPVRFIFSHSALKEGWDNPNVFQICALKHVDGTGSAIRRRQEVGRGLRLCVDKQGIRQDFETIGEEVHQVNCLTVIANESYEDFARGLQQEIAEEIKDRPQKVTPDLLQGKIVKRADGSETRIDEAQAKRIYKYLYKYDIIDDDDRLTDDGRTALADKALPMPEGLEDLSAAVAELLDRTLVGKVPVANAATRKTVSANQNIHRKEWQELWERIKYRTVYEVHYDTEELLRILRAPGFWSEKLHVSRRHYQLRGGRMKHDITQEQLKQGEAFTNTIRDDSSLVYGTGLPRIEVRYDLVGELERRTNLTRRTLGRILQDMTEAVFGQYKINPEEFIARVSELVNQVKSQLIVNHITYHRTQEEYDAHTIFSTQTVEAKGDALVKNIYDYVQADSKVEADMLQQLESAREVVVYAKLPKSFHITTPIANYSPDWAVVFDCETCKHIYFVAETKGSDADMDKRGVEKLKEYCWQQHLKALSEDGGKANDVQYHLIADYDTLLKMAKD